MFIEYAESFQTACVGVVTIIVRFDALMRRVNFDTIEGELIDSPFNRHLSTICHSRVEAAERQYAVWNFVAKLSGPLIRFMCVTERGSYVVDNGRYCDIL